MLIMLKRIINLYFDMLYCQVAMSTGSLLLAIILFFGGCWHCYNGSYHYTAVCDKHACVFTHSDFDNVLTPTNFTIRRYDIQDVDIARIDSNGVIIEDKEQQKYASYNVKLKVRASEDSGLKSPGMSASGSRYITLSPHPIGRKAARTSWHQFRRYLDGKLDTLSVHHNRNMTLAGILSIV